MRKKTLPIVGLVLVVLAGIAIAGFSGAFSSQPPEQEEVTALLTRLSSGSPYRFASQCYVTTEGEQREYFLLSGEKAGVDSHFTGTILGTEVELYLVEDMLYQRNGDGNWRVNQVPDVGQAVSLFAELDPASAFCFTDIQEYEYLGLAEWDGGKDHLIRLVPTQSGWVGEYFTDVSYTLWISRRDRSLLRAELTGVLQEDPNTQLTLGLELYDVGKELVITPPALD